MGPDRVSLVAAIQALRVQFTQRRAYLTGGDPRAQHHEQGEPDPPEAG